MHKHESVLRACGALFAQREYAAATTRDLAQCAGLSPSGLYNRYNSKEGLYLAVFALFEHDLVEQLRRWAPCAPRDPDAFVAEYVSLLFHHTTLLRLMLNDRFARQGRTSRDMCLAMARRWRAWRPDVDAAHLVDLIPQAAALVVVSDSYDDALRLMHGLLKTPLGQRCAQSAAAEAAAVDDDVVHDTGALALAGHLAGLHADDVWADDDDALDDGVDDDTEDLARSLLAVGIANVLREDLMPDGEDTVVLDATVDDNPVGNDDQEPSPAPRRLRLVRNAVAANGAEPNATRHRMTFVRRPRDS